LFETRREFNLTCKPGEANGTPEKRALDNREEKKPILEADTTDL
jgi:hypothetical protein